MRDWKWKWKKALARLLTAAMVCVLVPATTVHAAYEVLVEPAYEVTPETGHWVILSSPSGNMSLVIVTGAETFGSADGTYVLKYANDGIEATYKEGLDVQEGFSSCGYVAVRDDVGEESIMNNSGEIVKNFGSNTSFSSISYDGYVGLLQNGHMNLLNLLQGTEVRMESPGWIADSVEIGYYGNGLRCLYYTDSNDKVHYYFLEANGVNPFPTEYTFATPFYYGHAIVKTVGSQVYEIMDSTGAIVGSLPPSAKNSSPAWRVGENGMIAFADENWQYGYANLNGDIVIAPQYAVAGNFRNGYARVVNNNSYRGMIDTNGDIVIPFGPYWDISDASENGLVWVRDWDGKIGVVRVSPGAAEDPPDEPEADLTLPYATQYVPYTEDIGKLARETFDLDQITFQADTRLPSWLTLSEDGQILSGVPMVAEDYIFPLQATSVINGVTDTKELTVGLSVYPNSDENVDAKSDEGYEINSPKPVLYADNLRDHTFVSVGEFAQFQDAYMDGQVLTEDTDYTAEAGSTKITVRAQTFSGLDAGSHTFAATFKDGSGHTKVAAQNFPIGAVTPPTPSSSDSDDNDDTPTYFHLNIPSFDHGKVSCNSFRATYGSKVTLTVTPDDGYQLDSISVIRSNGKQVELTRDGNEYSFKMPGISVKVDATFSELPGPVQPTISYSDVPANAWFVPAVEWVAQRGYMIGCGDGTFAPDGEIDASAIAVILAKLAGTDLSQYEGLHDADIPDGQWYSAAVAWAKAASVLPEGAFHAGDAISRSDMAVILVRYLQFLGIECPAPETPVEFADAGEMTSEQHEAFQILYNMNVLSGMGNGVMGPSNTTTRAQMAQLTRNIYDRMAAVRP